MNNEHIVNLTAAAAQVRAWLAGSPRILIGAGAGLSAAAAVDYTDAASFARLFPALVRRGFRARYQLIGYTAWSPAQKWGYWATHVYDVRFAPRQHPVYQRLLELVADKDYFVLTSNVDALFPRHGFDEQRLFTPQGDYAMMHCTVPCSPRTWSSRPIIERILPTIDPQTQEVTDPSVIPTCPHCGAEVFMNVRLDGSFSEEPYIEQARRWQRWLHESQTQPLLVIEIGAGFNTPSVVRWPMEDLVHTFPQARLVRINLAHAEVPDEIADRSISLAVDAGRAVDAIWQSDRAQITGGALSGNTARLSEEGDTRR